RVPPISARGNARTTTGPITSRVGARKRKGGKIPRKCPLLPARTRGERWLRRNPAGAPSRKAPKIRWSSYLRLAAHSNGALVRPGGAAKAPRFGFHRARLGFGLVVVADEVKQAVGQERSKLAGQVAACPRGLAAGRFHAEHHVAEHVGRR